MIRVKKGYNDLATRKPDLAAQWHPTKNGNLTPYDVAAGSDKKVWWLLPYDDPITGNHFDFEWEARIDHRKNGRGCPFLKGKAVWVGFNDLATLRPDLAAEWHPENNGDLKPTDFTVGSNKKVWWKATYFNPVTNEWSTHEWEAEINHRSQGTRSSRVNTSKTAELVYKILNKHHLSYVSEKKFNDLKDKSYLPFDFFVNEKYLIELDGEQHFEVVNHFEREGSNFNIRTKHDNMKNQYCHDNNILLLRIPHIYNPVTDKERIEEIVLNFIKTGKIPQEIIDFYAQYEFSNYAACIKSKTLTEAA